jgi:hypothetical protein
MSRKIDASCYRRGVGKYRSGVSHKAQKALLEVVAEVSK